MKFDAALWPVPPGVEIHFYFQCMREPQFYKTRTILDKLMLEVGMFPDRVATARRDDPQPLLLGASGRAAAVGRVPPPDAATSRWISPAPTRSVRSR